MQTPQILTRITPRTWVRTGFLLFFLWSCWRLWAFYQWAIGNGGWVARPEATAGLVPLGALMSLIAWFKTGIFDPVMPAGVVIIVGAVVVSILFKRAFCGWICPVGSTVAIFGWLGRMLFGGRNLPMPRRADLVLRVPKYIFAAMVLFWLVPLPAEVSLHFQQLPYYATSDLKILYGILHPAWGYWALAGFVGVTSMLWGNTWCRYLCPLGAIYGGLGVFSAGTVGRHAEACTDCGTCTTVCHARIDVAKARVVRSAECDGCQDCVRTCPTPGAISARFGSARIPWQFWPILVVVTWLLVYALAFGSGNWTHGLPDDQIAAYMRTMKLSHDWGGEE